MTLNAIKKDTGAGKSSAKTYQEAKVTDTDGANYQGIAMIALQPALDEDNAPILDGDGNTVYRNLGMLGTPDFSMLTEDQSGNAKLDTLISSAGAQTTAISNTSDRLTDISSGLFYYRAKGQSTQNVIELSDTTDTELFPAPDSGKQRDMTVLVVANNDTAPATVDLRCNGVIKTTITVPAGATVPVPLNSPIYGTVDFAWMAQLRANPATGTVAITAVARQFVFE